jgi:hypothetical protein
MNMRCVGLDYAPVRTGAHQPQYATRVVLNQRPDQRDLPPLLVALPGWAIQFVPLVQAHFPSFSHLG